ncbi:MAG: hypothetical protein JO265_06030 [Acidimicrobiia bacterium]|nr:hypothetical protein [Acidimicrobiia bacterium]
MALAQRRLIALVPTAFATVLAVVAVLVGWHGVDFPAQLYRVGLFHRDGLVLWDSQWYGGHWTFDYSVLFPLIAGIVGIQATQILSAAAAAFAFDRLAVGHFGPRARLGSFVFAAGTLVQVAIGQLPFLVGEAFALGACLAASRKRWPLAVALAALASLMSPLAGGFLALSMGAWILAQWPQRRVALGAVAAAAAVPVLALAALFPGQGWMPFPTGDFVQLGALFAGLWVLIPKAERPLRIGAAVYLVAIALSFVVASPMGGNISRLGECLGAPLLICAVWKHRRWLAAAAVVPLVLLQWSPAFAAFTVDRADPSAHAAYFAPLLQFLDAHREPLGRVEVVPMRLHWEAAYVAPRVPLARGWERQLDTAYNPIFYTPGALTPSTYEAWLLDNGVRYVALPDTALDFAGQAEGRLIAAGVAGLGAPQQLGPWRVYPVTGSTGLVQGPGVVTHLDGTRVGLHLTAPGTVVLRVRYDPRWAIVSDTACLAPGPNGWTAVTSERPGDVRLTLGLFNDHDGACPPQAQSPGESG